MAEVAQTRPAARENWTTHIPRNLARMKLSEYTQSGKSRRVTLEDPLNDEGGRYTVKPRKSDTKLNRELDTPVSNLHVKFLSRPISEASVKDKDFVEEAVYDYVLGDEAEPMNSSMIDLIEYSSKHMLLRATFKNNQARVVYGGVPVSVFARLKYVNDSGGSVGGAFWDLIRVEDRLGLQVGGPYRPKQSTFRRYGSKYASLYESEGHSLGERSSEYKTREDGSMTPSQHEAKKFIDKYGAELELGPDSVIYSDTKKFESAVNKVKRIKNPQVRSELMSRIRDSIQQSAIKRAEAEADKEQYAMDYDTKEGAHIVKKGKGGYIGTTTARETPSKRDLIRQANEILRKNRGE